VSPVKYELGLYIAEDDILHFIAVFQSTKWRIINIYVVKLFNNMALFKELDGFDGIVQLVLRLAKG
jgi:hypothetical protein